VTFNYNFDKLFSASRNVCVSNFAKNRNIIMSNIQLQDLGLVSNDISGAELFNDSENFIKEMTEDDLVSIHGGITPSSPAAVPAFAAAYLVGYIITKVTDPNPNPSPKPKPV
jgi:hypothetical protein